MDTGATEGRHGTFECIDAGSILIRPRPHMDRTASTARQAVAQMGLPSDYASGKLNRRGWDASRPQPMRAQGDVRSHGTTGCCRWNADDRNHAVNGSRR